MTGRKKPYSETGIRRLKCCRPGCGNRAEYQWSACANGNLHVPICPACDLELNEMVLRWMGFPDWREKIKAYREKVKRECK